MTRSLFGAPIFRLLALCFALMLLGTACGETTATTAPAATTAAASTTAAAATTAAATTAAAGAATTVASGSQSGLAAPNPAAVAATPGPAKALERKIIRNATLTIQVEDMEIALTQLRSLATTNGGYMLNENTTQTGNKPSGVMVMQVPSDFYEATITRIRQIAYQVDRQESTSQDVSEEYVDLQSEMANLKVTESGLQKLIDKAQKLDEIISLQKELTNVRGEIEKRQGRLNFLDNKTAFSTITVNLALKPVPVTPVAPKLAPITVPAQIGDGWQPDKSVAEAWALSLNLLGKVADVALKVLVFSWWYLPFVVAGIIIWRVKRKKQQDKKIFG